MQSSTRLGYKSESVATFTADYNEDVFVMPASVAQERYWLLDQLEPGNSALNMPLALELTGYVDVDALRRTLDTIVSRHEILRTTFVQKDGSLTQVIASEQSATFDVVDLRHLPEPHAEADRVIVDEAHVAFDLAQGPLFISKLVRIAAEDSVLLLTLHHIVCDGWSNGVLVREIGEIYDAFSKGKPCPMDELPIQYGDFAVWQRDWISGDGFEEQLAYWKGQLGNELPALQIPADFPRSKNRTSFGSIESLLLPRALTRAIKALAQREDVTPYMIFLAAFNVLLYKYCGQDQILIGSPTANRIPSDTEPLIGTFANTLLLKSDVSGDPSISELLQRVKDISLGAFGNQTLPFEKLVETIRPARGQNRTQLFQVLFIFQTAFMQPVELDDLKITPIRSVSPGSTFELSLGVVERTEGTRFQLEYNTDLFKAETIKRMLGDLETILKFAVLDSRRKLSEVVFDRSERKSNATESSNGSRELASTIVASSGGDVDLPSAISSSPNGHAEMPVSSSVISNRHAGILTSVANGNGKVAAPAAPTAPVTIGGKVQVEETLQEIWKDVLHLESVSIHDDFFEVGGHSLLGAQIFSEIAKRLGADLPLATLFKATTIEQLAKIIRGETKKDEWTSLVAINTEGTKTPLFLIHAAGGNVLFYKDLAEYLGSDQPLYALQSRGLNGETAVETTVEELAARYIEDIRSVQPEGPFVLGGRCFGGYVALEIAQLLRRQGQEVAQLVIFDSGPPRTTNQPSPVPRKSIGHHLAKSFRYLLSAELHIVFVRWLNERKFMRRISDQLQLRKQRKIDAPGLPRNRALERAYKIAARNYVASPYEGRITLIRSDEFSSIERKQAHLAWGGLARGGFEYFVVPGRHLDMFREPAVKFVAQTLKDCLSVVQGRGE